MKSAGLSLAILILLSGCSNVDAPPKAASEKWGVYSERTGVGNDLSCWVCTSATAGTAACLGSVLIPDTEWDTRDQAAGSACVLKRRGKCLEVQNHKCAN